jgi:hypothetical protein
MMPKDYNVVCKVKDCFKVSTSDTMLEEMKLEQRKRRWKGTGIGAMGNFAGVDALILIERGLAASVWCYCDVPE